MKIATHADRGGVGIRRPYFLLCVVSGMLFGYFLLGPVDLRGSQRDANSPTADDSANTRTTTTITLPNESLSPEQVVEIQMQALADYRTDRSAIRQVFAFASPSNRSVTGPLARFESMISKQPYYAMVENEHWMAGKAVRQDTLATVLVTTVDAKECVSLYRFYLSLQSAEYAGCWMTDRVTCLYQSGRANVTESI